MVVSSGEEAIRRLDAFQPDVPVLDYHLPKMNGLDVLAHIRSHAPRNKVIMITRNATVEVAVQAMKSGAFDYLAKPVVLGEYPAMIALKDKIQRLAAAEAGRAGADQAAQGARRKKVRRLSGLRENRIDFRIIAATNQDLQRRVHKGKFRSELYYRLRLVYLPLPPLRERGGDILVLARVFLAMHGVRYRKPNLHFVPAAERKLQIGDDKCRQARERHGLSPLQLFGP